MEKSGVRLLRACFNCWSNSLSEFHLCNFTVENEYCIVSTWQQIETPILTSLIHPLLNSCLEKQWALISSRKAAYSQKDAHHIAIKQRLSMRPEGLKVSSQGKHDGKLQFSWKWNSKKSIVKMKTKLLSHMCMDSNVLYQNRSPSTSHALLGSPQSVLPSILAIKPYV